MPRAEDREWSDCAVCHDTLSSPVTHGTCGANFHKACLEEWLATGTQVSRTCPLCRGELPLASELRVNHVLEQALSKLAGVPAAAGLDIAPGAVTVGQVLGEGSFGRVLYCIYDGARAGGRVWGG